MYYNHNPFIPCGPLWETYMLMLSIDTMFTKINLMGIIKKTFDHTFTMHSLKTFFTNVSHVLVLNYGQVGHIGGDLIGLRTDNINTSIGICSLQYLVQCSNMNPSYQYHRYLYHLA